MLPDYIISLFDVAWFDKLRQDIRDVAENGLLVAMHPVDEQ
jgi:hypothetical protein